MPEGAKFGIIELKKYLSTDSELFNTFIIANSMYNNNETGNPF